MYIVHARTKFLMTICSPLYGKNNYKIPKEIITNEHFLSDMTRFAYEWCIYLRYIILSILNVCIQMMPSLIINYLIIVKNNN